MKKLILLIALLLFACSSDNPVSSNAESVNGQITFEFESVTPYQIVYPSEDLSTGITETIRPKSGDPTGLVTKTTRTFDYQFPPFSSIRLKLSPEIPNGYLIIKILIKTDSTKFAFTSKNFTSDSRVLLENIDIPF